MGDLSDQELQAMVEALRREGKLPDAGDESARLYAELFNALTDEPPVDLSLSFSKNVIRQIQEQQATRHQTKAYLIFGLTLLLLLGAAFAFQATQSVNDSTETWHALSRIKWPVLFLLALIALIQWADHRLVKPQQVNKYS